MPRFYDSDEGGDDEYNVDQYNTSCDMDSGEEEEIDEEFLPPPDTLFTSDDVLPKNLPPPVIWKRLKLGDAVMHISSYGDVKPYESLFPSTKGMIYQGTPYRTYVIDDKEYLVHDLVWHAFKGEPPHGWEVRHKVEYTMFPHKVYSNALHHLDIYQSRISKPT